jgi:hypothetical protein
MDDRQLGDFQNIEEVKTQNRRKGQHFFDASTMRFFGSRVGYRIYGGATSLLLSKTTTGEALAGTPYGWPTLAEISTR